MQPLKDLYFPADSYKILADDLFNIYPKFSKEDFIKDALNNLDDLELKQRITRTVDLFSKYLPVKYPEALEVLTEYVKGRENNFYYLHLPQYVSTYGLGDFELSMQALKEFTKYSSSEDAIRYFLLKDFDKTMEHVMAFAEDENYHVRRLASEGTRPRLPWCIQLKDIVENPKLTLPILEKLKADPEKYVQKSVANHLNDYSKDHPDFVVGVISKWDSNNKITKWIIGHGTRTLVKQGHQGCLKYLGFGGKPEVKAVIKLNKTKLKMGEELSFDFIIESLAEMEQNLVIDYAIHFMKANGKNTAKVFKLTTKSLKPGALLQFTKKYKYQDLSTRKHYQGKHYLELLINGKSQGKAEFELV